MHMPAASTMAGLSVLLETTTTTAKQQLQCAGSAATIAPPQIISKATILNMARASSVRSPCMAPPPATCSFLHRCFLCRRELADGVDIYIYRGDRAFCSEECRCRHILLDDDDDGAVDCARIAAADRSRRRRRQAVAGGFAF